MYNPARFQTGIAYNQVIRRGYIYSFDRTMRIQQTGETLGGYGLAVGIVPRR